MRHNSLKEIARELSVSRGTLDRVIHNRGGISPETTARVQELVELVDEIAKSGKPVVTFNNDVISSRRLAHVGSNYRVGGRLAGEVLAKAIKSGAVAVLRRSSSYFQNRERVTVFTEVIDSYEAIRMAGCFGESTDYDSGYRNMKRLLESVPDLRGLFMLNNESDIITATCDAISDSGRKPFDVVTLDLPSAVAREITRGRITATVCQDPFSQGYDGVKILFKYLSENVVPTRSIYSTRLDVFYRENLDNYGFELYRSFF